MKEQKNYRIKEWLGMFWVQVEIEKTEDIHGLFMQLLFCLNIHKPKTTKEFQYLNALGFTSRLSESVKFKTIKEATDFIVSLEPKYHQV